MTVSMAFPDSVLQRNDGHTFLRHPDAGVPDFPYLLFNNDKSGKVGIQ